MFPLKIVISHSYVNVYQRVLRTNCKISKYIIPRRPNGTTLAKDHAKQRDLAILGYESIAISRPFIDIYRGMTIHLHPSIYIPAILLFTIPSVTCEKSPSIPDPATPPASGPTRKVRLFIWALTGWLVDWSLFDQSSWETFHLVNLNWPWKSMEIHYFHGKIIVNMDRIVGFCSGVFDLRCNLT